MDFDLFPSLYEIATADWLEESRVLRAGRRRSMMFPTRRSDQADAAAGFRLGLGCSVSMAKTEPRSSIERRFQRLPALRGGEKKKKREKSAPDFKERGRLPRSPYAIQEYQVASAPALGERGPWPEASCLDFQETPGRAARHELDYSCPTTARDHPLDRAS